jgi:L-ascorbate metabolism protein UlaG (beta-lactamase superfamily)
MPRYLLTLLLVLASGTAAAQSTKVHWYGQAAFRIETPAGGVILIDPWLKAPSNPDKASLDKLGRVDYILVTHGHWDHIGEAVEIGKKTGATLVAPYGLQYAMKSVLGFPEKQATLATGGNVGGTIALPKAGAKVSLVHAVHGSELVPPMVPAAIAAGNPVGYVLEIENGPTIYHTGDTDIYSDMKLIADYFRVDLMLANIGGHFAMGPARAAQAAAWVQPRKVVPMHFGTYPILAGTPAQFKAELGKRGYGGEMIEMKPGETREF